MVIPNEQVYTILAEAGGVEVYQKRPEVISELPCITYYIADNRVEVDLSKEIGYQEAKVVVDIWSNTSKEGSEILSKIEQAMREQGFMLEFSSDVDDPEMISHITSRFNLII